MMLTNKPWRRAAGMGRTLFKTALPLSCVAGAALLGLEFYRWNELKVLRVKQEAAFEQLKHVTAAVEGDLALMKELLIRFYDLGRQEVHPLEATASELKERGRAFLHFAILKEQKGKPELEVEHAYAGSRWRETWITAESAKAFESQYLASLRHQFESKDLAATEVRAVRIRKSRDSSVEWVAMAYPITPRIVTEPRRLAVALLPVPAAFPSFGRFSASQPLFRGYLVAPDGLILAHAQMAYEGTRMPDAFSRRLTETKPVKEAVPIRYKAIDGLPAFAVLSRLPGVPYRLGTEIVLRVPDWILEGQTANSAEGDLLRPRLREDAIARALACLLTPVVIALALRSRRRRGAVVTSTAAPTSLPASLEPAAHTLTAKAEPAVAVDRLASSRAQQVIEQLRQRKEALALEKAQKDQSRKDELENFHSTAAASYAARMLAPSVAFETRLASLQTLEELGYHVAETAAKMAASPALFFLFKGRGSQRALLHTFSGLPAGVKPPGAAVTFSAERVRKLLEGGREGPSRLLREHGDLEAVVQRPENPWARPESWEAWPFSSFLDPELFGFVVLLEPPFGRNAIEDEVFRTEFAKVQRMAGLKFSRRGATPSEGRSAFPASRS